MVASRDNPTLEDGAGLLKAGKASEAIHVLEQLLSKDPDDAQLHMLLGAAYNQLNDKLHSIHHFEESVRLEETPRGFYNLGQVYEFANRIDEAVRQYRVAVDLDPEYAPARQALKRLQDRFAADHPIPADEAAKDSAKDTAPPAP